MITPLQNVREYTLARDFQTVNPLFVRTLPVPTWRESQFAEDPDLIYEVLPAPVGPPCPSTKELLKLEEYLQNASITRSINTAWHHCTGTTISAKPEAIIRYWREKLGWTYMGYHILITYAGELILLQDFNTPSNGVRNHNISGLNICTIGGLENGKAKDTRSPEQIAIQIGVINLLNKYYTLGHRGHNEVANKACPSYNYAQWATTVF